MDEELTDITGQLALHALLLEQLFVNAVLGTSNPAESWKAMREGILQASQLMAGAPDNMSEQTIVQEHVYHHAKIFCERVTQRIENPQAVVEGQ